MSAAAGVHLAGTFGPNRVARIVLPRATVAALGGEQVVTDQLRGMTGRDVVLTIVEPPPAPTWRNRAAAALYRLGDWLDS